LLAAEVDVVRVRPVRHDLAVNKYNDDDFDSRIAPTVKMCVIAA
jgi:hypothetical protein